MIHPARFRLPATFRCLCFVAHAHKRALSSSSVCCVFVLCLLKAYPPALLPELQRNSVLHSAALAGSLFGLFACSRPIMRAGCSTQC